MKFAIETRFGRSAAIEFADRLISAIHAGGSEVVDIGVQPDMVLSVGGDGTMLGATRQALRWDVPVLGFNLGTLGFLAQGEPEQMETTIQRLMAGDYVIEERMTVLATVGTASATGVNDVVVEKVDTTRLISLEVSVDDVPFITYRADGLIVATPTGSTAYSFSAGGPLLDPRLEALVMTPVASHSLFDRALVLPGTSRIGVRVTLDRTVRVNVDKTDLGELVAGQTVEISRGDRPAKFVSFRTSSFPELVKDKFGLH